MAMVSFWKVADAKNRFSEVVTRALAQGPQIVDRRGEKVVVLAHEDYTRLTGETPAFKDLLLGGPSLEGLDLERSKAPMRDIAL